MKYTTSHFGAFLVVGLEGPDSESDRILAENLFDVFTHDDVFHGRINFTGKQQFMRFLIYKELLRLLFSNGLLPYRKALRHATKHARHILTHNVSHVNFMKELEIASEHYVSNYES